MWKSPSDWRTDRVFIDQLRPEQVSCVLVCLRCLRRVSKHLARAECGGWGGGRRMQFCSFHLIHEPSNLSTPKSNDCAVFVRELCFCGRREHAVSRATAACASLPFSCQSSLANTPRSQIWYPARPTPTFTVCLTLLPAPPLAGLMHFQFSNWQNLVLKHTWFGRTFAAAASRTAAAHQRDTTPGTCWWSGSCAGVTCPQFQWGSFTHGVCGLTGSACTPRQLTGCTSPQTKTLCGGRSMLQVWQSRVSGVCAKFPNGCASLKFASECIAQNCECLAHCTCMHSLHY